MNSALKIEKDLSPVLIIDKEGIIGSALIKKLKEEALLIFISQEKPEEDENIIFIPFKDRPATIPDNTYSQIVVIDDPSSWVRPSLLSFAKKADDDKTAFIYITQLRTKDDSLIEEVLRFHRAKILILGDIFNTHNLLLTTLSNKFIHQAREGRIDVPGNGTKIFYPVSFEDSIDGIIKAAFSGEKESLNYVFSKHGFSYLAFSHEIQRENPFVKIDFIKQDEEEQEQALKEKGSFIFGENYPLREKIKQIKVSDYKVSTDVPKTKTTISYKNKKSKNYFFLKIFFSFLLLILMPAILTFFTAFLGLKSLEASKEVLIKGDLVQAASYSSFAKGQFNASWFFSKTLLFEAEKLGLGGKLGPFLEKIEFGKSISETETALLNIIILITQDNPKNTEVLGELINDAKNSLENYQKQAALNKNVFKETEEYKSFLALVSSTTGVWDELLGLNEEKKYLVLFQNNMELRPGGGFIGSYGTLSVNKGRVSELKIHDVYEADGQLKGHVEPPFAIRRYLKKVHWYLRDSNFDINPSKGAATSAYFLNLETKEKVNGVIAIDVTFIKYLMEAIGPVYVTDYKETVNAKNVFYLTESHVEKNFFPGSTQKKDFLRSLASEIQFKLTKEKKIPFLPVLLSIQKSLAEKHLFFAFDDQSIQSIFSLNKWSSNVPELSIKKNEVVDFVGISEANLGINKANYYVSRNISKSSSVDETGKISSTLTIDYKNSSKEWPGGDYVNYLRLILPQGAQIEKIEIDGKKQNITPAITNFLQYEAKEFRPPTGLEIERYTQDGKDIFGFLVNTPSQKTKTIKIYYALFERIKLDKKEGNLRFYFLKQPGTDNVPVSFSLSLAKNYKFIIPPKEFSKNNNTISTNFKEAGDIDVTLKVNKN